MLIANNILTLTLMMATYMGNTYKNPMRKWPTLTRLRSRTSPDVQSETVRQMIGRLIPPDRQSNFVIIVNSSLSERGRDVFIIKNDPDGIRMQIHGSTGVAAAWGFQYYTKTFCGCHFSWSGNQVSTLPATLPRLKKSIKILANDLFRYYQNVCTVSYSSVWWNWTQWEREIDWMVLNGINLPLAFAGQEEIFRRIYMKLGFRQSDLDVFFAGPAFLAWGRMGNIDGWGGPLPESWYSSQLTLQHQILKRMRDFGMVPVLPAFSGHVPQAIEEYYPNATVTRLSAWGNFNRTYCCTYLLDHADPLFQTIGRSFIREMQREFGTDHVYNCDTFNEMTPPSADPKFVAGVGRAVFRAMTAVDPDAVWIMQGWMFKAPFWANISMAKALLTSVPIGRMLVLDLQSEADPHYARLQSYFGQPWIWCMLHNFGGVKGLYGVLDAVNKGPFQGRIFPNSTMVGTGITPEGIEQNDVMYELMNEMAFLRSPVTVDNWFADYAKRRYSVSDKHVSAAWQGLAHSVYNCTLPTLEFHGRYIITQRPSLLMSSYIYYDESKFLKSWDHFVRASGANQTDLFQHDLVDVTREALVLISGKIYANMIVAFSNKNSTSFASFSSQLLDILSDLEVILASDKRFLLGVWLNSAKSMAESPGEAKLYEYNARNQITLWGPNGEIRDYATKQWSGIVSDYYRPRWALFIHELQQCLDNKTNFNAKKFASRVFFEVETPFTLSTKVYPTKPVGNSNSIAQQIHKKWRLKSQSGSLNDVGIGSKR